MLFKIRKTSFATLHTAPPPSRPLASPPTTTLSLSPLPVPPSLPFRKPNYFQLVNCSCTSQGRAREGTWLRRGPPPRSPRLALGARRGPGRGRARRWVGLTLICWRRAAKEGGGGSGRRRGAGSRRREGWSAPPSLALGVLTVPKLKLSAAASAGKLRGARGPRTKLEKSKQAAAAGYPPSFPLPLTLLRAVALLLPSSSSGRGGWARLRALARRLLLTFASPLFCLSLPVPFPPSADHGESGQQLTAAPRDGRLPLLEAVRRLRG